MYRPRRRHPKISMAPLIDIVFQLLVFAIFSAGTAAPPAEVAIQLPSAYTGTDARGTALVLFVSQDGLIYLDDKPVEVSLLRLELSRALEAGGHTEAFVFADAKAEFAVIMGLMDEIRLLGMENIGFAVHRLGGEQ